MALFDYLLRGARFVRHALPEGQELPDQIWRRRHAGLQALLLAHAVGLMLLSAVRGNTALFTVGVGSWLAFFAVLGAIPAWSRKLRASWVSLGLMTSSALLVNISGGYIEMHFHYFVMVTILALYQDWPPFLLAVGYVVFQHGVGGWFFPQTVYNHPDAWVHPWKWAFIHAGFLSCACVGVIIAWRANESIRARIANLLNSSSEGFLGLDHQGHIVFANETLETLTGYSASELAGRPIEVLFLDHLEPQGLNSIQAALASPDKNAMGEAVLNCRNGARLRVEYRISPLKDRTELSGIVLTLNDVTERRRVQDAARVSEERFRSVAQAANDAIISADGDGKIMSWNNGAKRIFLYSEEEVLGRPMTELMPERYRERHRSGLERLRAGGEPRVLGKTVELHGLRKGGEEFPLELSLSTWKTGGAVFYGGILRDITERKRIEENTLAKEAAEKANLAKSEFLSRMSHELRTPLNSILGFGQLLEVDKLTPGQRESVEHILKGGRHLLDLINEVLDITGIEAGRMHLSIEPVRVGDVLREALDLVRPMMAAKQIKLDRAATGLADRYVQADRQRLRQVLLNLLTNAVKYNHEGGTVRVSCGAVPFDRLRINVTDTGRGITADRMPRLLPPFHRPGPGPPGGEGVGLGLVLSKRLIEAMGGTMGADSELEHGSTFWAELSLTQSPLESAKAIDPEPASIAEGSGRTHTVLYIEDNLSNLTLIERLIAKRPTLKLIPALQGQIGLDLARQHHPDLILLDLHLPDISGEEVLRRIREDPGLSNTPVVMLTADAIRSQIQNLLNSGARAYLTKPLDVKNFFRVIDEILLEKDAQP